MKPTLNSLYWLTVIILLFFALFFTNRIFTFKKNLQSNTIITYFKSGQKGKVIKIIDGDEVSMQIEGRNYIVRMLGIRSFDPTVSDPVVKNIASEAVTYLRINMLNKKASLVFDEFKTDKKNRILSYIHTDRDCGIEMVKKGLTLVYTRYNFSRMKEYLEAESRSVIQKKGLWANPRISTRSIMLKEMWKKEKNTEN